MSVTIPAPPPDVDTDRPPRPGHGKAARYDMWRVAGCKGCHQMMEPIGLGLEGYDRHGRARAVSPDDEGNTGCTIAGGGELMSGQSSAPFMGVAGLSDRLVASRTL